MPCLCGLVEKCDMGIFWESCSGGTSVAVPLWTCVGDQQHNAGSGSSRLVEDVVVLMK